MITRRFLFVFALFIFLTAPVYAQRQDGIRPSFKQGYARNMSESKAPHLWRGKTGHWATSLGATGNTLYDTSIFKNHGTLTNMDAGTDWVVDQNYALNFDGSDDYVDMENEPFWDGTVFNHTYIVLVNQKGDGGTREALIDGATMLSKGAGFSAGFAFSIDHTSRKLMWTSNAVNHLSDSAITDNTRQLVGVTIDGSGNLIFYINGISDGTASVAYGTDNDFQLRIGNFDSGTDKNYFNGNIASALIYNRVLTPNEMKQWYINPFAGLQRHE